MVKYLKHSEIKDFDIKLKLFLSKVPFGRFLLDRKIDKNGAVELEFNNILRYADKGEIFADLDHNNEIVGLIGFHFSEWDTNVFLKRMAIVQYFLVTETNFGEEEEIVAELLNSFHTWSKANSIDVAVTKLDTLYFTPIYILQQNGYVVYECVTYRTIDNLENYKNIGNDVEFRFANKSDDDALKKIALKNTFPKSHFYLDPNFDRARIELMYSQWIENALNSKQKIVLIEEDKQIAGVFIYDIVDYTQQLGKKIGVWKSAFVDSNFRDKGVGFRLFKATLQACINDGVDLVDTSLVEKNIISQSFHDKLGFRLVNTQYTLHKWF